MTVTERVRLSTFPGLSGLATYVALREGAFARAGLDVELEHAESSAHQLGRWRDGSLDVIHTAPDHVLVMAPPDDPVIVGQGTIGELTVVTRAPEPDLGAVTWGVDGTGSGFTLFLRAVLEDRCGPGVEPVLLALGGSGQRYAALMAPEPPIGGAVLHPGFDQLAFEGGAVRVAGHLDVVPDLMTVCVVTRREVSSQPAVARYVDVWRETTRRLGSLAPDELIAALGDHGMAPRLARATIEGVLRTTGFGLDPTPTAAALAATVELRRAIQPGWSPGVALDRLLLA